MEAFLFFSSLLRRLRPKGMAFIDIRNWERKMRLFLIGLIVLGLIAIATVGICGKNEEFAVEHCFSVVGFMVPVMVRISHQSVGVGER